MNPWLARDDVPRGEAYDARMEAQSGPNPHGEADFVEDVARRLGKPSASVLDGGCGTGRVAIVLARRGFEVAGVDIDPAMLATAQRKAPELEWTLGDLATVRLERTFDVAVLAGNTMIFVGRGREEAVLANVATHLRPGGLLVAGFQLKPTGLGVVEYDQLASAAGFELVERWATWHRDTWDGVAEYAVSVHRIKACDSSFARSREPSPLPATY